MPFWRTPVTDAEAAAHLHFVHNHAKERAPAPPRRSRWYALVDCIRTDSTCTIQVDMFVLSAQTRSLEYVQGKILMPSKEVHLGGFAIGRTKSDNQMAFELN